jgi:hypothetical protein
VTREDLDVVIAGLVKLRGEVDLALDRAVLAGRAEHDLSWDQVADLTGMSARTAAKRWGNTAPAAKNGEAARNGAAVRDGRARAKRTKAVAGTAPG